MAKIMAGVAEALKMQAGIPTDVPPAAAPSPAPSTTNLQGQASPPPQKSVEEILALKDRALAEKDARIKALEDGSGQQLQSIMDLLQAKLNPKEPPKPPELPPLPPNLDELPTKEQIEIIAERKALEISQRERAQERDGLMRAMAPVLTRMKQTADVTDKLSVMEKYPQFDYEKHLPIMSELEKELPGSKPLERAIMAAQRTGSEAQLLPPSPQAPATLPAVPSMSTASGSTGAPPPQQPDISDEQLWSRAAELGMKRQRVPQGMYIDELLKRRLKLK